LGACRKLGGHPATFLKMILCRDCATVFLGGGDGIPVAGPDAHRGVDLFGVNVTIAKLRQGYMLVVWEALMA